MRSTSPQGQPRQFRLHAVITSVSRAVRSAALSWEGPIGTDDDRRRRRRLTAADLLVLVPWLIFGAGLAVIGCRVLSSRAACRVMRPGDIR
jgi:hypothetical protein